jgi:hypothetical protein
MLKNPSTKAHPVRVFTGDLSRAGRFDKATPWRGRTMNKIVVVRPTCKAVAHRSAGLPPGQRVKRRVQMHLAFLSRNPSGTDQPG